MEIVLFLIVESIIPSGDWWWGGGGRLCWLKAIDVLNWITEQWAKRHDVCVQLVVLVWSSLIAVHFPGKLTLQMWVGNLSLL